MMPRMGTIGTSGVTNWRGALGSRTRKTHTPMHTSTNANSVPNEVMSPTMSPGTNAANKPTNTKNRRGDFHGVRNFGSTSLDTGGGEDAEDAAVMVRNALTVEDGLRLRNERVVVRRVDEAPAEDDDEDDDGDLGDDDDAVDERRLLHAANQEERQHEDDEQRR